MRWSVGFGPFRVYSGSRTRRRPAQPRETDVAAQRQREAERDFRRTRQFSGRVSRHTVYESGAVSFTVRGDGSSMEITIPDAAPQKILDLRNGDMVRIKFSPDGGIDELDVGRPS